MGLFGCCMENSVDSARGHWPLTQMLWTGQGRWGQGRSPWNRKRHGKDGAESSGKRGHVDQGSPARKGPRDEMLAGHMGPGSTWAASTAPSVRGEVGLAA